MSFSETIFLFFLALVIFGPKKLPEIARQVGKLLNEFRRASNEFKAQIEQEIAHLEVEERKKKTMLPPAPPVDGTASRTLTAASSAPSYRASDATNESTKAAPAEPAGSTLAVATDQPVNGKAEPAPATEALTSSTSQESHA